MVAVLVCHATDPHRSLGRRTRTHGSSDSRQRASGPSAKQDILHAGFSRLGRAPPPLGHRSASFFPNPSAQPCSPMFVMACDERAAPHRKVHSSPWHSAASTARKSSRRTAYSLLVHGAEALVRRVQTASEDYDDPQRERERRAGGSGPSTPARVPSVSGLVNFAPAILPVCAHDASVSFHR